MITQNIDLILNVLCIDAAAGSFWWEASVPNMFSTNICEYVANFKFLNTSLYVS